MAYTTETKIENFLDIDISSAMSSQINDWITAVEKWINGYCDVPDGFEAADINNEITDGIVDSHSSLIIYPRNVPVNSISLVKIGLGTSFITLQLTDGSGNARYNIHQKGWRIVFPNQSLATTGTLTIRDFADLRNIEFFIELSYNHGYVNLPKDIELAATMLAADIIRTGAYNKMGARRFSQGSFNVDFFFNEQGESELVLKAKQLLEPYRKTTQF